jgi:hypothetical protein
VTYWSLALTLATGGGIAAYYLYLKEQRLKSAAAHPAASNPLQQAWYAKCACLVHDLVVWRVRSAKNGWVQA